ncbi:hypothetical protein, partial [Asanoa ferruginea]|uniref:hypothetical protein n=1 Tax=Asanoa ferruginea TaxID=53367 RepID=UPI001944DF8F
MTYPALTAGPTPTRIHDGFPASSRSFTVYPQAARQNGPNDAQRVTGKVRKEPIEAETPKDQRRNRDRPGPRAQTGPTFNAGPLPVSNQPVRMRLVLALGRVEHCRGICSGLRQRSL